MHATCLLTLGHVIINATLWRECFKICEQVALQVPSRLPLILKKSTLCFSAAVRAEDEVDVDGTVEDDLGKSRDGSRTDDEVVQRWVALCKSDLSLVTELWSSPSEQVGWTLSLLHKVNMPNACAHKCSQRTPSVGGGKVCDVLRGNTGRACVSPSSGALVSPGPCCLCEPSERRRPSSWMD